MIEIKVPTVGESINEVTLLKWVKKDGEYVDRDEVIAELESEKATFEVNAEQAGSLKIIAKEGDTLNIGSVLAHIDETAEKPAAAPKPEAAPEKKEAPAAKPQVADAPVTAVPNDIKATPVAAAIIADKKVAPASITPSGPGGKILKNDVLEALSHPGKQAFKGQELFTRNVRKEKMSNLRKTISRRLVEAKNTTAMLTTFNEVDMKPIMDLRNKYKDKFKEKHNVGLGFMSFFTKAVCVALSEFPSVNAMIDGDEIVFNDFADVSIAVSAPKGLVVPVVRNAEKMNFAQIETEIMRLAGKARDNKLSIEEMTGGTFTITNGGVFGSMMSTPIINAPQSAILGMHNIVERAVVVNGEIVVRPIMYVALSYDHRIIDGRESVGFLVRVKQLLEDPLRLLLDV